MWWKLPNWPGQNHSAVEDRSAGEPAELAADLDRAAAENEASATELTACLAAAAADTEAAGKRADVAEEKAAQAALDLNALHVELPAARATADTLQRSLDSLLGKVTPAPAAAGSGDTTA